MKTEQRREETSRSILQAAALLFADKGYDATGVAEICRRAGVSKGAFYYHFPTKQSVFIRLIDEWLRDLEASLDGADMGPSSPSEWLLAMSGAFQKILDSQTQQMALILEFWTQASHDDTVRQAVLAPFRSFQQFFQGIILTGVSEGDFRQIDPVAGAQVLLSLASGLFFQGLLDPRGSDWGEVAETSMQVLLDGLRSER